MKITLRLEANLAMGKANTYGTSLMGYMPTGTYYKDLVRVFGEPQAAPPCNGKIKVEWCGHINDQVFTIYDYKSSVIPKDNLDWHIGGHNKMTVDLLIAYFNAAKKTHEGDTK